MYIVSACLLGKNCKYSGGNNRDDRVIRFSETHRVIPVCPETEGGLKAPREPAERVGDRVLSRSGEDWTAYFKRGAETCWERAQKEAEQAGEPIEGAILKARSPSCGSGKIYDGSFPGTITDGNGCFAEILISCGIPVKTEEDR
jgi:uncharacterized protein YbbK (DUF523 family)